MVSILKTLLSSLVSIFRETFLLQVMGRQLYEFPPWSHFWTLVDDLASFYCRLWGADHISTRPSSEPSFNMFRKAFTHYTQSLTILKVKLLLHVFNTVVMWGQNKALRFWTNLWVFVAPWYLHRKWEELILIKRVGVYCRLNSIWFRQNTNSVFHYSGKSGAKYFELFFPIYTFR